MTTDELIERAAGTLAVAELLWRKSTWGDLSESQKDEYRRLARQVSTVFEQAQAERVKRIELTPPPGWFMFGTHVDDPTPLEFYGSEFTESGMPMWERPAQAESEWVYLARGDGWDRRFDKRADAEMWRPRGYVIYRRRKAVPVGHWEPVEANE